MSELDQYDYTLPKELIAQHPLERRHDARLLVVRRAEEAIEHLHIRDLPEILAPGDCMVVNDTRVVPARLVGRRMKTGGRWEGLFLNVDASGAWRVMSKTRGKMQPGEDVSVRDDQSHQDLVLRMVLKNEDGTWIAQPQSSEPWTDLLDRVGRVPLPPYIRGGEMTLADRTTYQTTFATNPGAVAAPTAGLHFSGPLLERLEQVGVSKQAVTLHVGQGTFRGIDVENLADHVMHGEWGKLSSETASAINDARSKGGRIVAVGTTSVRVLETAADEQGTLSAWEGTTDLFIRPPYEFRAVDVLLTNFHLPRTTLLVLVRTFGGDELIRRAYEEAIEERYRFYSYGDAMLIL